MPRTKRKQLDSDEADPDFKPTADDKVDDDDDYNDASIAKAAPAPKRGRRSTTAGTGRKSATSASAKAKAAAHIPYEPHAIDDPIPEAPAPIHHLNPPTGTPSPYGPAEQQPFPWHLPVSVPDRATNWWQMTQLDPDDPDSMGLLLETVAFSSTTRLAFPDPALLDPSTLCFIGPPDFFFFKVPFLIREPLLQAKRPKLEKDGKQHTDFRGSPLFESHKYSLPADARAGLLKPTFDGTGDNHTIYSDAFNKILQEDKHLKLYKEKNKSHYLFPGGSTPLAFLREVKFVARAHFVRPLTVPIIGDSAALEGSPQFALVEVLNSDSIALKVNSAMEEYITILIRPYPQESYALDDQLEDPSEQPNGCGGGQDLLPADVGTMKRTSWRYHASVYLRLNKVKNVLQGPNKVEAQKVVHELLQVFPQTRYSASGAPFHTPADRSLASPTEFAARARLIEVSPDPVPTFATHYSDNFVEQWYSVVQLGPNGPFYDPEQGLFAFNFSALTGEPVHLSYRPKNLIYLPRASGYVGRPVSDLSLGNHQRIINTLHLIAAQPCSRPEPIPLAFYPRIPSRATLVVTAGACIAQWEHLAHQILGSTASIVTIPSNASLLATPQRDLLLADVVIMSDNVLLQPTSWTRRTTCPSDFTLNNISPRRFLLPAVQQEYYYGHDRDVVAPFITFLRQDVPARRMEILAPSVSSPSRMFDLTESLVADVTITYWHRVVLDHWTEVSSLHSLLSARSWTALSGQDHGLLSTRADGFKEGGVFMDHAHFLEVQSDHGDVQEPVVLCDSESVFASPLDLALKAVWSVLICNDNWRQAADLVHAMRVSDDCRGYPYLAVSSFPKWKLTQVAERLDKLVEGLCAELRLTIQREHEAINKVFLLANQNKAMEITLMVLNREVKQHFREGHKAVSKVLGAVAEHMPTVKHNGHIDMKAYTMRMSTYDRYGYRPVTRNDQGVAISLDDLRQLGDAVQNVCVHVRSLSTILASIDDCEGALRLVRNTVLVEGWIAKLIHQGADGVVKCPTCDAQVAADEKLVVSSAVDFASCSRCQPIASKDDCFEAKYEFCPIPNIKRSRDWLAQLTAAEMRGYDRKFWPRAFIQTVALRALAALSSDVFDDAHDAPRGPKRIAIFLAAEHIKSVSKCFQLLNLAHVAVDNRQVYKSLKALYSARPMMDASDMGAHGVADESSSMHSQDTPFDPATLHIPIVLVDAAYPRMARLRIPDVTHVFLASGWRSKGPSNCVETALRPGDQEQNAIHVVSFEGDPGVLGDNPPLDPASIRTPSRLYE